ncbi:uncharacterized protein LOC129231566 [Uloborus diversus]|uniref:uncharacterized protein LOC129231566 n=1 Tax=Uloborus diversus TaxID=327109 RepID=UPI002409DF2B|nr:uncharacterized protein LOC129231566 [Uloborus diversus]
MEQSLNLNVVETDDNSMITEENASNYALSVSNELRKESNFVSNPSENLCLKSCAVSDSDASFVYNVESVSPKQSDGTYPPYARKSLQSPHVLHVRSAESDHLSENHAEFTASENQSSSQGSNLQVFKNSKLEDSSGGVSDQKFPKIDTDSCDQSVISSCDPCSAELPDNAKKAGKMDECLINRFNALSCASNQLKDSNLSQSKKRKREEMQNSDTDSNSVDDDASLDDAEIDAIPFFIALGVPSAAEVVAEVLQDDFDEEHINEEVLDDINCATEVYIHKTFRDMIIEKQEELLEKHRILTSSEGSAAQSSSSNDEDVVDIFAVLQEYPDLVPLETVRDMAIEFMFARMTDALGDIFC